MRPAQKRGVGVATDPDFFPLWDDNPSDVDLLGFASLVAPAVQALTRPKLDPVCVGVFGPWGAGKTTVAQHVKRELEARSDVLVIYAEPWAFDPTTDAKARLIAVVLNAIDSYLKVERKLTDDLKVAIAKLAKRIRWSRAVKLAAKTALTAQLPTIDDLADVFSSDDRPVDEPSIDGFREDFGNLMMDSALAEVSRVVVIVDDLDRCLPDTVVDVLEAIKLFLAVPKMAFLLAADEKAVQFAIAKRYAVTHTGMEREASELAGRYLDKIVHIPIRVPVLSLADVEAYVLQLMILHVEEASVDFERVRLHCDERRGAGKSALLDGLGDSIPADYQILTERLSPVLYEGMDGNPRRIKRFLNEMWLRSAFAKARGVAVDHTAVAKLMVLEQVHETAFNEMLEWVRSGTIDERLSALQDGTGESSVQLSRWAQMEPRQLNPTEVRKYLVLAASLRGSTIPAEDLPAHLRDIAGRLLSSQDQARRTAMGEAKMLSQEDLSLLGVHAVDALRAQPGRQAQLAEVVAAICQAGAISEASTLEALRKVRASDIDVPLVTHLAPPGAAPSMGVSQLLALWDADPDLSAQTRRAIAQVTISPGG